ncbi:hypothetical protein [Promicromonospora soli]
MSSNFIPASSMREAASRMYALSGRLPDKSRGPKRALVALALALHLDVKIEDTNATVGGAIADHLGVIWPGSAGTSSGQVTLEGMNWLLLSTAEALRKRSIAIATELPETLIGWGGFEPARSKYQAVNRISMLTDSGPQDLGPGSKERKSVLTNLATALFPEINTERNKVELSQELARRMNVPWTNAYASTGYTITLDGLNTILAGAERILGLQWQESRTFAKAEDEGAALAAILADALPNEWDGKRCVTQMKAEAYGNWRQTEWPGWYTEFLGLPALNYAFPMPEIGGIQRAFGQTAFDFTLGRVWDLKAHTSRQVYEPSGIRKPGQSTIILNDAEAVRECVTLQGLGFLIVSGEAQFDDDGAFDDWHREFTREGREVKTRANTGFRRRRKKAFNPLHCDAYWIPNIEAFDAAITAGTISIAAQGRQQIREGQEQGAARRPKVQLTKSKAPTLRVAGADWKDSKPDESILEI